jgi:uncharacterized integral membrane protein
MSKNVENKQIELKRIADVQNAICHYFLLLILFLVRIMIKQSGVEQCY